MPTHTAGHNRNPPKVAGWTATSVMLASMAVLPAPSQTRRLRLREGKQLSPSHRAGQEGWVSHAPEHLPGWECGTADVLQSPAVGTGAEETPSSTCVCAGMGHPEDGWEVHPPGPLGSPGWGLGTPVGGSGSPSLTFSNCKGWWEGLQVRCAQVQAHLQGSTGTLSREAQQGQMVKAVATSSRTMSALLYRHKGRVCRCKLGDRVPAPAQGCPGRSATLQGRAYEGLGCCAV